MQSYTKNLAELPENAYICKLDEYQIAMTQKQAIQLFEQKKVRTVWDTEKEKWYFSVVDVVAVLTDSPNPRNYWKVLKHRLIKEGNETVTNCNQLKLVSSNPFRRRRQSLSSSGWRRWQPSVSTRCKIPSCPLSRQWPTTAGWVTRRHGLTSG